MKEETKVASVASGPSVIDRLLTEGARQNLDYPARALRLRALGLLLADGVPIVGLVKTFWRETGRTGRKRA